MQLAKMIEEREPKFSEYYPVAVYGVEQQRYMNWWGIVRTRSIPTKRMVLRARP